jgi:type II secretory pathway pseudopilin PulG
MNMHNLLKFRVGGFSLIELLIVVIFIGIFAAVAVPRFNLAGVNTKKDEAFVRKLTTDLRKTRQMAISNAADNPNGFWLKIVGSSPNQTYEIRNIKTNTVVETFPVDSRISFSGTTQLSFTPLGTLNPITTVQMTVIGQSKRWVLDIYGYTGSVKCTEQ